MSHAKAIPDDRQLSPEEVSLVRWMLEQGDESGARFLPMVENLRVASKCSCGCGSIDFATAGVVPPAGGHMTILADFVYRAVGGGLCGAFLFENHGQLAGLELWSIDGRETPKELPTTGELRPLVDGL